MPTWPETGGLSFSLEADIVRIVKIADMNWGHVEEYLARDDRAVVPLGCTEQHAHLSLSTDSILAERVAVEAAEPLGLPVFPVLAFGITPGFLAYPGTISLRTETYLRVLTDILDSLARTGFRRVILVNGHGGNQPAVSLASEWQAERADAPAVAVKVHHWWNSPRTWEAVQAIDPMASHASWMENFPWTRLVNAPRPTGRKSPVDPARLRSMTPEAVRQFLGDGNFGGLYERADADMLSIWQTAVAETREAMESSWP